MDLDHIQSMVRYLTKEPFPSNPQFATNARVLEFANQGQLQIQSITKCFTSSNIPNTTGQPSLNTVAGQRIYAFPDDCLELLSVKVSVWSLERKTLDWFNMYMGYQWWTYSGVPLYYWIEKKSTNSFGIFYTPQAVYPIALTYARKPTDLVNSTDSPDLDRRLDMCLVYYICARVMEGRREMNYKSNYWNQKYQEELAKWNTTADQSMEPVEFMGDVPVTSD